MSETSEKLLSTKMYSPRTSKEDNVLEVFNTGNNRYSAKVFKIRFSFDVNTGVARVIEHTKYGNLSEPYINDGSWKDHVERKFFMFILEHTPVETIKDEDGEVIAQIKINGV